MSMSVSRRNQEKLQLQQQKQANGGVLLKNIFGIYASHPWLSVIFVILFALFTSALFEVMSSYFAESSFERGTIIGLGVIILLLLVLVFLVVWRLHYGAITPKTIAEKRVLVTLVSAFKDDVADTTSYQVLDAVLYSNSRQAQRNLLEEVVFIATEDPSSQAMAEKLVKYVEEGKRTGTVSTVAVNDKYPDEIKAQMSLTFSSVLRNYGAGSILADYTGGTKNMSIALHSLAQDNFVTSVYLYSAMDNRSKKSI